MSNVIGKFQTRFMPVTVLDGETIYTNGSPLMAITNASAFKTLLDLPFVNEPMERPKYWVEIFKYAHSVLELLRNDSRYEDQYDELLEKFNYDDDDLDAGVIAYFAEWEQSIHNLAEDAENDPRGHRNRQIEQFFSDLEFSDTEDLLYLDAIWAVCSSDDEFNMKVIDMMCGYINMFEAFDYPEVIEPNLPVI